MKRISRATLLRMRFKACLLILGLLSPAIAQSQDGGLVGWLGRKMDKPPAPNMTVQLVADGLEVSPDPSNRSVTFSYFLILPNGAKAMASCFAPGPKNCVIEPFVAENRKKTACKGAGLSQTFCFSAETYKAYRSGNNLIVFSASAPAYMSILGPWDELKPGLEPVLPPSGPQWTAICNDDSISYSTERSGTCSDHRGVKLWRSQQSGN